MKNFQRIRKLEDKGWKFEFKFVGGYYSGGKNGKTLIGHTWTELIRACEKKERIFKEIR